MSRRHVRVRVGRWLTWERGVRLRIGRRQWWLCDRPPWEEFS